MAHDVFVSYSTKDKLIADAVCAKLEQDRIRVWIAPRDVPGGANFAQSIIRAINSCKVFVLIWSANTNASGHILNEINQAFDQGITIIPFRIQDVQPTDEMRYYFGRTHWLDAISPPLEKHIATLRDAILVNLGRELKPEPALVQRPAEEKAEPAKPRPTAAPPKRREEKAVAPKEPAAGSTGIKRYLPMAVGGLVVLALAVLLGSGVFKSPAPAVIPTTAVTATAAASTPSAVPPDAGSTSPTQASTARTIVVTSAEDSGPGTLRQAILDAWTPTTITFDPAVFPPEVPVTIQLLAPLPPLSWGYTTLDASNTGVILDGSQAGTDWTSALLVTSGHNTIKGLQIVNFSGPGVELTGEAEFTTVGGDREVGKGPIGEGNLLSGNSDGVFIEGSDNIITGNLIGTDVTGSVPFGNNSYAIVLASRASRNTIGPNNVMAYSGSGPEGDMAVINNSAAACENVLTANSIHDNSDTGPEIAYHLQPDPPCPPLPAPVILHFDLASGVVSGEACAGCTVEIFSTQTEDGEIFEGSVTATEYGNFTFEKGAALAGPFLTATVSTPGENTSEFSEPTASRSAIGMALDLIQNRAPSYETGFDSSALGPLPDGARIEDSKLILSARSGEDTAVALSEHASDSYALGFDFRLVSDSGGGKCIYETSNEHAPPDPNYRAFSAYFEAQGRAALSHPVDAAYNYEDFAEGVYDATRTNTVIVIVLKDHIAGLINGKPLYTILDPLGAEGLSRHGLSADSVVCEFDSFRLWSLEGWNLDP